MTRREAREAAFILIFEKELNNSTTEELVELATETQVLETDDYVLKVFEGVYSKKEELDTKISSYLKGWNISRISKVSLAVLRLALFEILYMDDIPVSVSINEAVELSKKFTTKDDASFVNGILSSVAKENE